MNTINSSPLANEERMLNLLIQQATIGLDDSEAKELIELTSDSNNENEPERFERVAAAVHVAQLEVDHEIPLQLKDEVLDKAGQFFAERASGRSNPISDATKPGCSEKVVVARSERPHLSDGMRLREVFAYAVAAAAMLFLLADWNPFGQSVLPKVQNELTVAQRMATFVEKNPDDLVQPSWNQEHNSKVAGKILWSDSMQEGYMVFDGLPINDPKVEQYQLWIFDTDRGQEVPVDGGVFNVTEEGKVVVPVDAHVPVENAVQFAVTVEKPGGVMRSNREKIPVLAVVE